MARPGASRGQIGETGNESLLLDIENDPGAGGAGLDPGDNGLPR